MFTGLVEELGSIQSLQWGRDSARLTIRARTVLEGTAVGDSIAVNGICLTVTDLGTQWFAADAMPETVRRTGLADLRAGSAVNLERALRVGDRLGGHIVSGHIDGIGTILQRQSEGIATVIQIETVPDIMRYVILKGSIAVDGASLTVVAAAKNWFSVSLIPHTAIATSLGAKKLGSKVNLETDVIGKYVEKLMQGSQQSSDNKPAGKVSLAFLQENGFF